MRQYPPGPRNWFPGAPILAFGRDALGYLEAAARKHGDVVHLRVGPRHFFLLNHPDHVKDVLVTHHARFTGLAFEAGRRIIGDGLLSAMAELPGASRSAIRSRS